MGRLYSAYSDRLERQRKKQEEDAKAGSKPRLIRLFEKRVAKKKDVRIVIGGEGGAGKSTLALDIGEDMNPSLYVDHPDDAVEKAVCFTAKEYMNGVTTLPSFYDPPADPLERTVLDFDEPGQAWYHRQFMSEANQILSKTMLGFRFKQFVTPLSVPTIDLLDLDALRLVNWLIWVSDQGKAEVYRVMVQKFGGPPWYKKVIDRLSFRTPRAKLAHAYEKKKFKAQDELYERYGKALEELERPKFTKTEIVDLVKKDPKKYSKNGAIYVPYLQRDFHVGLNVGYLIKAILEPDADDHDANEVSSDVAAEDLLKGVVD